MVAEQDQGVQPAGAVGHVAGRAGGLHGLVLLSHHVEAVAGRKDLYGITEAMGAG